MAFAAVALAILFWWPLFRGAALSEEMSTATTFRKKSCMPRPRGPRIAFVEKPGGNGYPIVGESQKGPFYPFNVLLYGPVTGQYGLQRRSSVSLFAGVRFHLDVCAVAGVDPLGGRICRSGLYLRLVSFAFVLGMGHHWRCLDAGRLVVRGEFLSTRRARFAFGLFAVLTVQLLAGHFNLAFLTQSRWFRMSRAACLLPITTCRPRRACDPADGRDFGVAVVSAFGLAALQLGPTWELKQSSQREAPGEEHNLAHGSIPISYWSQVILPWYWYSPSWSETTRAERRSRARWEAPIRSRPISIWTHPPDAGPVEAGRLYWTRDRVSLIWLVLSVAALVYTTDGFWPARHVPGFNFFQGPGRYGVITTLGVAILAGKSAHRFRADGLAFAGNPGTRLFSPGSVITALTLTSSPGSADRAGEDRSRYPFHVGARCNFRRNDVGIVPPGLGGTHPRGRRAVFELRFAAPAPAARVGRWTLVGSRACDDGH